MSATSAAAKQRPPSPPQSNDGDFDLSAVQQHNAALGQEALHPHIKSIGLAESTLQDQYGDPSDFQTAVHHAYYPTRPGFHRTNHPATPPTTGYDNLMRTRSGTELGSPLTVTNPETSRRPRSPRPRAKRPPRNAKAIKRTIELLEPLSKMTRDWAVPLGDINAKVHRSAEDRQQEVNNKKNNGRVPRPMNSFMLYRSAYAERVKKYCNESNHQIISQVTGASWAMEPQEIKELYENYADIDRQNHQIAHPYYKFAPNKNGPASRKRKGRDDDDDRTDWGDLEYDASGCHTKRATYGQSVGSRSQSSTPFETIGRPIYDAVVAQSHPLNPSSYHASNPRSMPPLYPADIDDDDYEQWAIPYSDNVEDVKVRRVLHSGTIAFDTVKDQSLVGLPHGPHSSYISPHAGYGLPQPVQMNPLDPRLDQYGTHSSRMQYEEVKPAPLLGSQLGYGQVFFAGTPYGYSEASAHPGMATLTSPQGSWDQPLAGANFEEELEKWPV